MCQQSDQAGGHLSDISLSDWLGNEKGPAIAGPSDYWWVVQGLNL